MFLITWCQLQGKHTNGNLHFLPRFHHTAKPFQHRLRRSLIQRTVALEQGSRLSVGKTYHGNYLKTQYSFEL